MKYRYHYDLTGSEFYTLEFCKSEASLVSVLRELCLASGIVIRIRDYCFRQEGTASHPDTASLPLMDIDIIDFDCRFKTTSIGFTEIQKNLEIAQAAL